MTALTEEMFQIFDQPEFSFKKIKQNHTEEEVAALKDEFKQIWQKWKMVNLAVTESLPDDKFAKVHVESWTNGWNLRDHYWASYRLKRLSNYSPCIGVMLDRKQLQVYLMFQHYKSEQREGTVEEYNQLLNDIPNWSQGIDLTNWYLWDKNEMEFADHLPLEEYLSSQEDRDNFNQEAVKSSFLLGKFAFRKQDQVSDMETFIRDAILEIMPLYEKL